MKQKVNAALKKANSQFLLPFLLDLENKAVPLHEKLG